MARKKKAETKEVLENIVEEFIQEEKPVKKKRYNITDANRLRLTLEKGSLENTGFDSSTIENFDARTKSFKGCELKDSTFKNVNMQGCNFADADDIKGNIFIDCDLRWGKKPEGFKENNEFINTRL